MTDSGLFCTTYGHFFTGGVCWCCGLDPLKVAMTANKWKVTVLIGRPSADRKDFFNSLKFHDYEVEADSRDEALSIDPLDNRCPSPPDLSGGYQVINWYAFPLGG